MSPSPTPRRSSKTHGSPDSGPILSPVAAAPGAVAATAGSPSSQPPRNPIPPPSTGAHTVLIPHKQTSPEPGPDLDQNSASKKRRMTETSPTAPTEPTEVEMKDKGAVVPPSEPTLPPAAPPEETTEPPPKKPRTNKPWSPAEEKRLKAMRDENKTWSEIAKMFPNRTEGSVKKHWYKDMHYADFAEDESQALLQAIKEYDANKWKVIGQKVGKPAKACEQYAKENFTGRM